jgi:hypothetical protein
MEATKGKGLTYAFANKDTDARLRELILYISQRSSDDPRFGATKLNKILYFSDFIAYRELGEPMTGTEYQRLAWGPAPRALVPIRDGMVEARDLAVEKRRFHAYDQARTVALRDPDLSKFSSEQISLVDQVIQAMWEFTGSDASRASHRVAWEIVEDGESIPYEAAFLYPHGLTPQDVNRLKEMAAEYRAEAV